MQLLMVSPHLPDPSWGAGTRSYYLLKALAREHAVSLLALAGSGDVDRDCGTLAELTQTLRVVSRRPSKSKRRQQLMSTLRGRSYLLDSYMHREVQQELDAMLSRDAYDAVLFESVFMAGYRLPEHMPMIIDEHNIEYELLQRTYQREKGWLRKGYNWWESRLLKPIELERCRKARMVLVTSERERLLLQDAVYRAPEGSTDLEARCIAPLPQSRIEVVPNGVDIDVFDAPSVGAEASRSGNVALSESEGSLAMGRDPSLSLRMTNGALGDEWSLRMINGVQDDQFALRACPERSKGVTSEPTIIFTGTMNYYPNIDAVLSFARECWPLIRSQIPSATWQIVGKDPPAEVRDLAKDFAGIMITGTVPDVRPYLAGAAVAIAPIRIGSGTRLKILEALAMRKAIVSTSLGCEGLSVMSGRHLMVADSAQTFAQSVVDLLQNAERSIALGNAGRELVEAKYSWRRCGDMAVSALENM